MIEQLTELTDGKIIINEDKIQLLFEFSTTEELRKFVYRFFKIQSSKENVN